MNTSAMSESNSNIMDYSIKKYKVAKSTQMGENQNYSKYANSIEINKTAVSHLDKRISTLHESIIAAEKANVELRDNLEAKCCEVHSLRVTLQNEHSVSMNEQMKHAKELAHLRAEYDNQNQKLIDQIATLKNIADTANQEKKRLIDETELRKQHLYALVDKERAEKNQILSDYRAQTEDLISEQGKEINHLVQLLEEAKHNEEKYTIELEKLKETLQSFEEKANRAEEQIADEKIANQRRLKEIAQRNESQLDMLKHQHNLELAESKSKLLKQTQKKESLLEEIKILNQKITTVEAEFIDNQQRQKLNYNNEINSLNEQINSLKQHKETTEASLRSELSRAEESHDQIIQKVRRELELSRKECCSIQEESRIQRELLLAEQFKKQNEIQKNLESIRQEFMDEKIKHNETVAINNSLRVEIDSMRAHRSKLSKELEETLLEGRTKERQLQQQINTSYEQQTDEIHKVLFEHSRTKEVLHNLEVNYAQLQTEMKNANAKYEVELADAKKRCDSFRNTLEDSLRQKDELSIHYQKLNDQISAKKCQLESQVTTLQASLNDMEIKYVTTLKHFNDEKSVVEEYTLDLANSKNSLKEAQQLCDRLNIEIESYRLQLEDEKSKVNELTKTIDSKSLTEQNLREELAQLEHKMEDYTLKKESEINQKTEKYKQEYNMLIEKENELKVYTTYLSDEVKNKEEEIKYLKEQIAKADANTLTQNDIHEETINHFKESHDAEIERLEDIISSLRMDLTNSHHSRTIATRDATDKLQNMEKQIFRLQQEVNEGKILSNQLHIEIQSKDQLIVEIQGTVKLMNTQLIAKDTDVSRIDNELQDTLNKLHESLTSIGRKDAQLAQLNAKIRLIESRKY